jgi:MEMO1 family protein
MLRPAYLAGTWYPGQPGACRSAITEYAADTTPETRPWRGLIGPHAGWTYSGKAAAHAYRWLAGTERDPDLVVVFGSHRGPFGPSTIFLAEGWETPLGMLANAAALADRVQRELAIDEEPVRPRRPDNAVEVHLPFVRHFFPRAELLMLGVEASPRAIDIGKRVAELVAEAGRRAVYVGSTDLTHYGPNYDYSPAGTGDAAVRWTRDVNDRGFLDRVLSGDAEGAIAHAAHSSSACCPGAVAACMAAVEVAGPPQTPHLVDHYLSYDVQPNSSFVGYAGIVL